MDPIVEKLLADAEAALQAERAASQAPQPASAPTVDVEAMVEKAIAKALESSREGVGRRGSESAPAVTIESDPASYLIKKSREVDFDAEGALTQEDKDLLAGFWNATFWGDPSPKGDR